MAFNKLKKRWIWTKQEDVMVRALAEVGISPGAICKAVGCHTDTLYKRYPVTMFTKRLKVPGRDMSAVQRLYTEYDRSQVVTLAMYGVSRDDIATCLGCSTESLVENFRDELDTTPIRANAIVAKWLFRQAKRSPRAAAFWLKARAGWRETQTVEFQGMAGVLVAPDGMTPEKWIEAQEQKNELKQPGVITVEAEDVTSEADELEELLA